VDLAKSVTRSLAGAIGVPLRRVVIRALDGEISNRDEFTDPRLYIGGEVRLDFESQSPLCQRGCRLSRSGCGVPDEVCPRLGAA